MNAKEYIHNELIRKTRSELIHSYQIKENKKVYHTIDIYLNYPQHLCNLNEHISASKSNKNHNRAINECYIYLMQKFKEKIDKCIIEWNNCHPIDFVEFYKSCIRETKRDIPVYIGADWSYMLETKQCGPQCFRYSEFVSISCFGERDQYLKYPGWVSFFNGITTLILPFDRCKNDIIKFIFPRICNDNHEDHYPEPIKIFCNSSNTIRKIVFNSQEMFNETNENISDIQSLFGNVMKFKKPETKQTLCQIISCVFTSDQHRIEIDKEFNSEEFQHVFNTQTQKSHLSKDHIDFMCANVYFIYYIYHRCKNVIKNRKPNCSIKTQLIVAS